MKTIIYTVRAFMMTVAICYGMRVGCPKKKECVEEKRDFLDSVIEYKMQMQDNDY